MEEIEKINSMRFNPPMSWEPTVHTGKITRVNRLMYGMFNLTTELGSALEDIENTVMVEIGSYKGESTLMFASSFAFDTIYSIDPLVGMSNNIQEEFNQNTKLFKGNGTGIGDIKVEHIKEYSFDAVERFKDESLDFVYIDGDHSFDNVARDILLYLPKIKKTGFIGGHDYSPEHPGVREAIRYCGLEEGLFFADTSWLYKL
mgnify:CR=1 FL=1|tara:strand:+ start:238 stop:843 length:606 start_codon:yes stop_codon:yes gene_type:complete